MQMTTRTPIERARSAASCLSIVLAVANCLSFAAQLPVPTQPLTVKDLINLEVGGCQINHYETEILSGNQTLENLHSQPLVQGLSQQLNWSEVKGPIPIGLECQNITAEQLHEQFNRVRAVNLKVLSLMVKDSNLTTLSNLPQGTHELKKMIISNTSIDLEVLREGGESLNQLTTLEITNEKISNIPRNLFQEMQSLKELRLENDEIASLDGDAFHNLDDSLEVLDLRKNRFNRFPMAVKNLAQLAVLDLTDNDIVIDTQENDLPEKLEPLLNLRELAMNRINCTCEFSSSPFFEWIARTHISGVRCFSPEKLQSREVIVFDRDEFCARSSATPSTSLFTSLFGYLALIFWCQLLLGAFLMSLF